MEIKTIKKLVSSTPMIEITYKFKNKIKKVYAKCEWFSLTGSVKDKVAFQILTTAFKNKQLKEGDKIVEVSSGNMGLSICAVANLLKLKTTILMPKNMSIERKQLLKLYGAELVETENFKQAFKLCEKYKQMGYFCPMQFENFNNTKAHENITAKEIVKQVKFKPVSAFVCGIGTSGTFSGVGKVLKQKLGVKLFAIEPKNARIISNKKPFKHHQLQGLSDEILPKLYNSSLCNGVIQISDADALAMAKKLCQKLSLGVGISSGANFLGCVLSGEENAVTIFADDNKKYLSTNLTKCNSTPLVESIELIDVRVL